MNKINYRKFNENSMFSFSQNGISIVLRSFPKDHRHSPKLNDRHCFIWFASWSHATCVRAHLAFKAYKQMSSSSLNVSDRSKACTAPYSCSIHSPRPMPVSYSKLLRLETIIDSRGILFVKKIFLIFFRTETHANSLSSGNAEPDVPICLLSMPELM